MPVIKSATKRARQATTRRAHNLTYKAAIKETTAELMEAIATKDAKGMDEALNKVYKAYDKATKRNVLNKKTAARRKSRLNRLAKEAKGVKATAKKVPAKKAAAKPATKKPAAKKTATKKPAAKSSTKKSSK